MCEETDKEQAKDTTTSEVASVAVDPALYIQYCANRTAETDAPHFDILIKEALVSQQQPASRKQAPCSNRRRPPRKQPTMHNMTVTASSQHPLAGTTAQHVLSRQLLGNSPIGRPRRMAQLLLDERLPGKSTSTVP